MNATLEKDQEIIGCVPVERVEVSKLKSASYNPPHRSSDVKDLVDAISKTGTIKPIDITMDNVIIDGHRRVAACKLLGIKFVGAQRCSYPDPAVLYAALNTASKKHTSSDQLYVWLENPTAVSARARKDFAAMEKVVGRDAITELVESGGSHATYRQAVQVARYCGMPKEDIPNILEWLVQTQQTYRVRKAIEGGIPPSVLTAKIKKMGMLVKSWE